MNLQLTMARSAAADADDRWRAHRRDCPKCSGAQRSRKLPEMCGAGSKLYADMKACQADLAEERKLAKLPMPGQEALFGEGELDSLVVVSKNGVNSL